MISSVVHDANEIDFICITSPQRDFKLCAQSMHKNMQCSVQAQLELLHPHSKHLKLSSDVWKDLNISMDIVYYRHFYHQKIIDY